MDVFKAHDIGYFFYIGGNDSQHTAFKVSDLARGKGLDLIAVGVPKTIDGDLKNEHIETSFGFDTATKIYAELVGNVERDVNSAQKYWHFIRLMGRSASHITLEVGFKTQTNITIVGEEAKASKAQMSMI